MIVLCSYATAGELNATFQKAKNLAMSEDMDSRGNYVKTISANKESYHVAFIPSSGCVGVVVVHEDGTATEVHIVDGEYEICEIVPPFYTLNKISEEEAVRFVEEVLKKFDFRV
jgi:hypothetical protein